MEKPFPRKIIEFVDRPKVAEILLLVFVFLYGIFYTDLLSGYWFEDDPLVFFGVNSASSPFAFFFDRQYFESGAKHQIAPFLYFSLWFDSWFSQETIKFAYVHNFLSLLVTSFVFFKVSTLLLGSRSLSLIFVSTWLLLPSTEAVYEFVAARHYLEGFMVSLLSIYLLNRAIENKGKSSTWVMSLGAVFFLACAMYFKEVFAASTLLLFFVICAFKRKIWGVGLSILLGGVYYFYRKWAIGTSVYYGSPMVSGSDLISFVSHLPYMLTANIGGYALWVVVGLGACYLLYKKLAPISIIATLSGFVFLGAALTYPVSFALLYYWQEPGTYYRWCFLLNTFILISLFYLVSKVGVKSKYVIVSLILVAVSIGSFKTQQFFRLEKKKYELEARTYLNAKNKLFYSEVPAWFFLFGLTKLKELKEMHFVNQANLTPDWLTKKILLEKYSTIWRLKKGELVEDKELYDRIVGEYSKAKKETDKESKSVH